MPLILMIAALATLLVPAVIAATCLVAALVTSMSTLLNRMMTLVRQQSGQVTIRKMGKEGGCLNAAQRPSS